RDRPQGARHAEDRESPAAAGARFRGSGRRRQGHEERRRSRAAALGSGCRRPRCHGSEDPRVPHRQVRGRAGRLGDSRHGDRRARRYAGGRVRALSADGGLPGTHAARARRHPARVRAPGPQDAFRAPGIAALMAAPGEKRSFAQDFFFELMRDSQRVRAVYLAERERWVRTLEISGREEILFELEMLLRGLDRFFNLRNLFGDLQPPPERDWKEELKAARDALHRSVHLSRKLIEQRQEQALLFRSFVEGSLADDRARTRLGAELREQRTPEESLFLLRTGLVAHQGILDHLLSLDGAPQSLFLDVGRALQHELFVSRYFCPPAALEFRAEYDRIGSVLLLEGLRLLDDEKKRRAFALGLLASFRALRSLRYVPSPPAAHTRRVLVILALVRSELHALVGYLESDLPRLYPGAGAPVAAGKAAAQQNRDVLASAPPLLAQRLTDRATPTASCSIGSWTCSGAGRGGAGKALKSGCSDCTTIASGLRRSSSALWSWFPSARNYRRSPSTRRATGRRLPKCRRGDKGSALYPEA